MSTPVICIVTDAQRDNVNALLELMGKGPGSFSRPLCATSEGATPATPPTHWLMSAVAASDGDLAVWQMMQAGNLPPLPEGLAWGVDGVMTSSDALAATHVDALSVHYQPEPEPDPEADPVTEPEGEEGGMIAPSPVHTLSPTEHSAAVLLELGLMAVPSAQV